MNRLTLKFVGDRNKVELYESEFDSPLVAGRLNCSRGKHSFMGKNAGSFQWTAAVMGMCSVFLKAKLFVHQSREHQNAMGACGISSDDSSWAVSFDYALSKKPQWILDMFGLDSSGNTIVKRLFHRNNPERKRQGPVWISVNTAFLQLENIHIHVNGQEVSEVGSIRFLLRQIGFSQEPNKYPTVRLDSELKHSSEDLMLSDQSSIPTTGINVLIPFLDHFVLAQSGYGLSKRRDELILTECRTALRLALVLFNSVAIPAVSYVQSPLCRRLLDEHRSHAHFGRIKLLTDAPTWREFFKLRSSEYTKHSKERELYRQSEKRSRIDEFPMLATEVDTTQALHSEWVKMSSSTQLHSKVFSPTTIEHLDHKQRTEVLTSAAVDLGSLAFIGRHLSAVLEKRKVIVPEPHLVSLICKMFFSHFCENAKLSLVDDLSYVRSIGTANTYYRFSYGDLIRQLRVQYPLLTETLIKCKSDDLWGMRNDEGIKTIHNSLWSNGEVQLV